jgi:mono/diheme cytochrome c family protein
MKRAALLLAAGLVALSPALAATRRATPPPKASFTEVQANEGARLYAVRCAMCHGPMLSGTVEIPGLTGKFMANWAGRPVGDLFDYVSRAMPQPAPGSLSDADNVRLVAFLLRANGVQAGSAPLPADSATLQRMALAPVPPR